MGNFFSDLMGLIGGKETISGQFIDETSKFFEKGEDILQDLGTKTIAFSQDALRTGATTIDNVTGRGIGAVRTLGSEALAFGDSTVDNVAMVIDKLGSQFFDTIQTGTLIGMGLVVVFLILFGDTIFQNGIRLGRINLL